MGNKVLLFAEWIGQDEVDAVGDVTRPGKGRVGVRGEVG